MIASNGDMMHTCGAAERTSAGKSIKSLARNAIAIAVRRPFRAKGDYPTSRITASRSPRYKGLLDDIMKMASPEDFRLPTIRLRPTAMAPDGSTFYAAPVAHLGRAKVDWDGPFGQQFADGYWPGEGGLPGLRANLATSSTTPHRFRPRPVGDLGSAFSPSRCCGRLIRAHNRDDVISNLYFVGRHASGAIPGVVGARRRLRS